MQDFRKLDAWQKSHFVALHTYAQTANFPSTELFGLTSQMRRAAVSIPANIAEGCYRGQKSLAHSLRIALGSAGELDYFVTLAGDLKLLPESSAKMMANEVSDVKAVITGLLKSVEAAISRENRDRNVRTGSSTVNRER